MGMILWTQGALEETVYVFDCFARLAGGILGDNNPLTRKARQGYILAKREWERGKRAESGDVLRFGTIVSPRKMDELALRVENEID